MMSSSLGSRYVYSDCNLVFAFFFSKSDLTKKILFFSRITLLKKNGPQMLLFALLHAL